MESGRERPRDAIKELKAAAMRSRRNYKMQQTLQMVTLRTISVGEELCPEYGMKYSLEYSSVRDLHDNKTI